MDAHLRRSSDGVVVPLRPRRLPPPGTADEAIWLRALAACDLITIDDWLGDERSALDASERELARSWRAVVAAMVSEKPARAVSGVWPALEATRRDALRRRLRTHERIPARSA